MRRDLHIEADVISKRVDPEPRNTGGIQHCGMNVERAGDRRAAIEKLNAQVDEKLRIPKGKPAGVSSSRITIDGATVDRRMTAKQAEGAKTTQQEPIPPCQVHRCLRRQVNYLTVRLAAAQPNSSCLRRCHPSPGGGTSGGAGGRWRTKALRNERPSMPNDGTRSVNANFSSRARGPSLGKYSR